MNRVATSVIMSPLATRLGRLYKVDQDELLELERLTHSHRLYERDSIIVERNQRQTQFILMIEGWAARCRYSPDGSRQIIHFLLPGDLATPDVFVIRYSDHDIVALSDVTVRLIDPEALTALIAGSNSLAPGLWWAAELEDAILREHIVRLGRRSARARIAHLLLELHRRLLNVDQATEEVFVMPLSQTIIADTLGLTNVYVSRSLSQLVKDGMIDVKGRIISIIDRARLAEECDFDIAHFHENSSFKESYMGNN